jgi:hypothetical protein
MNVLEKYVDTEGVKKFSYFLNSCVSLRCYKAPLTDGTVG